MGIERLRSAVQAFTRLVEFDHEATAIRGKEVLVELLQSDDWLPDHFSAPNLNRYQQFLLHCDPLERFSIVSFVWGPGQRTPIHDHTVWGLVGVLRGEELSQRYGLSISGRLEPRGPVRRMVPGEIDVVSPEVGDIHSVSNGLANKPSVRIHVYGANIGTVRRHVFDPETGLSTEFISGYSNVTLPNIWSYPLG